MRSAPLLLSLVLLAIPSTEALIEGPTIEGPSLVRGDFWTYRTETTVPAGLSLHGEVTLRVTDRSTIAVEGPPYDVYNLSFSGAGKPQVGPLTYLEQFVGMDQTQEAGGELDSEIVFVGHGIEAPEYDWNDYRGLDTRGKTLVMLVNVIFLAGYTFSCHSCRHVCGGHVDVFSKAPTRYRLWQFISRLNEQHPMYAWLSLFSVGLTDLYIRLVSMGIIRDFHVVLF